MTHKKSLQVWLIIFFFFLAFFIVLQVPAAWLIKKFMPEQRFLQNISGNIWQGQADWISHQVVGTLHWSFRPWELIRLRASSSFTLHTGQSHLTGIASYGVGQHIYLKDLNGKISPDTLATLINWQWPATAINLQAIDLQFKRAQGFEDASGQLAWAGGTLNYPMGQRWERIDVPPLLGALTTNQGSLNLAVTDNQKQRMADLALGQDNMLNVEMTQRFLLHAPAYQGQAGLDSAVITTRQPLDSLRGL